MLCFVPSWQYSNKVTYSFPKLEVKEFNARLYTRKLYHVAETAIATKVKELLKNVAPLDMQNKSSSATIRLVAKHWYKIVKGFLEIKAKTNVQNKHGQKLLA
jgi:hypothetical protein